MLDGLHLQWAKDIFKQSKML